MTNLTRWNPINEFEDLINRYNRYFGLPATNGDRGESKDLFRRSDWAPAVDIKENKESFVIDAELPGMEKDDVKVTVHEGVLTIQGERKQEEETGDDKHHRVERVYGSFTRRFTLPDNVDPDSVRAKFKNGILSLTLNKVEPVEPRSIEVDVE
ncbi:MAG: Hsp20/alpha crystallin family protein [Marinobacter sp.]